jgi:dihydroorotase
MNRITLRQPDDWHIHLRDNEALVETCASVSRYFHRAIVMPNLKPPVSTISQAESYLKRILSNTPERNHFKPLMTLYLTETLSTEEIRAAAEHPDIYACKLYPAGATTNSDAGVRDIKNIMPVLETMTECGVPLLVHGEVTHEQSDIFEREKLFIEEVLEPLRQKLPELKIVFEHITTKDAVDYVKGQKENLAATITAHHLLYNRNHMLAGGIRPHYYCLPILKKNIHQKALIKAATSGDKHFFIGTDSAPHPQGQKESACGCAGIYTAPAAIELYASVFENAGALDKLEAFASEFGADFYGLERNETKIILSKSEWQMPEYFELGEEKVIPIMAGETISWKVEGFA